MTVILLIWRQKQIFQRLQMQISRDLTLQKEDNLSQILQSPIPRLCQLLKLPEIRNPCLMAQMSPDWMAARSMKQSGLKLRSILEQMEMLSSKESSTSQTRTKILQQILELMPRSMSKMERPASKNESFEDLQDHEEDGPTIQLPQKHSVRFPN